MTRRIHGWIVDTDHLAEAGEGADGDDEEGRIGPHDASQAVRDRLRLLRGDQVARRWRCLDGDGELCYSGRYVGPMDERAFSPLDDFARPDAGATRIEYLNPVSGQWEEL